MIRLTERAAAAQDSDGATGAYDGPQMPDTISMMINTNPLATNDLKQYLIDNGATEVSVDGITIYAEAPPLLLGPITRHAGFRSVFSGGLYPRMDPRLDEYLTKYAAGELTAAEVGDALNKGRGRDILPETEAGRVWVRDVRVVFKKSHEADIRAFLKRNGANMPNSVSRDVGTDAKEFYVYLKVPLLDQLYRQPGVRFLYADDFPSTWDPPPESGASGSEGPSGDADILPTPTPGPQGATATALGYGTGPASPAKTSKSALSTRGSKVSPAAWKLGNSPTLPDFTGVASAMTAYMS